MIQYDYAKPYNFQNTIIVHATSFPTVTHLVCYSHTTLLSLFLSSSPSCSVPVDRQRAAPPCLMVWSLFVITWLVARTSLTQHSVTVSAWRAHGAEKIVLSFCLELIKNNKNKKTSLGRSLKRVGSLNLLVPDRPITNSQVDGEKERRERERWRERRGGGECSKQRKQLL